MQFPTQLALRRSQRLSILALVLHALAAYSLLLTPWPPVLLWPLLAMILASAWQALRHPFVVALRLGEDGKLTLLCGDGQQVSATVDQGTSVFSSLIVLRTRDEEQRRLPNLVLLPDSVSTGQFRQLRLWLRWCAALRADAGDDAG